MRLGIHRGNYYVHYNRDKYVARSRYLKVKLAKQIAKNEANLESGELLEINQTDFKNTLTETRQVLKRMAQGAIRRAGAKKKAEELSKIYTDFIFGIKDEKSISNKYDQDIVNRFQSIMNSSELQKQLRLYSQYENGVDLLTNVSQRGNVESQRLDRVLIQEKKAFNTDDLITEEKLLNQFKQKIDTYVKIAKKNLSQNGYSEKDGEELLRNFDDLHKIIKSFQSVGSVKTTGKIDTEVQYYNINNETRMALTDLVNRYNDLCAKTLYAATLTDQGYYGEVLIGAIQYVLNNGVTNGALDLLQELMSQGTVLSKSGKQHMVNDTVKASLKLTGAEDIPNINYKKNGIFDANLINAYFNKNKKDPRAKLITIGNQKYPSGIDINLKTSTFTADITFSWANFSNMGMSIKNYRQGFNTGRGISIIDGINLLSILQMLPSSFDSHFANLTSKQRGNGYGNNLMDARKKAKEIIALTLISRGLSGIRSNTRLGGEADFFTMIDSSSRRVYVYSTAILLDNIMTLAESDNSIFLTDKQYFDIKNYKDIIYENNYMAWDKKNNTITESNRIKGEKSYIAAGIRNSKYLIAADKVKLSLSIKKKGWESILPAGSYNFSGT